MIWLRGLAALALVLFDFSRAVIAEELCLYTRADGSQVQVRSREQIPQQFIGRSRCFSSRPATTKLPAEIKMPNPKDITLNGLTGRARLATALGPIELRWTRAVTELFGKTPERAMAEAAMAVNRALQSGSFPSKAQTINQTWQVVFMDENLPVAEIPAHLINNCHPGWMTPPANIYIVAQRAAEGCGGGRLSKSKADSRLAAILVHEIAHAIEYQLLPKQFGSDRMRAEGFASWFEQYAAGYSDLLLDAQVYHRYSRLAQESFKQNPVGWTFQGSSRDYGRASMFFAAIVSRHGIAGLMDLYLEMEQKRKGWIDVVQERLGWDQALLDREAQRVAQIR